MGRSLYISVILASSTLAHGQDKDWAAEMARAQTLVERQAYAEAEQIYRAAIQHAGQSTHPELQRAIAANGIGYLLAVQGRYREAEALYRTSLHTLEQNGAHHPRFASAINNLAETVWAQGRTGEAIQLCERALSVLEKYPPPNEAERRIVFRNLAVLHQARGDLRAAANYLRRCLNSLPSGEASQAERLATFSDLATLHLAAGGLAQAKEYLHQAMLSIDAAEPSVRVAVYHNLGILQSRLGSPSQAVRTLTLATAMSTDLHGESHPNTAAILLSRAEVHRGLRRYREAANSLELAIGIQEQALGHQNPQLIRPLRQYAETLRKLGLRQEARRADERARLIPRDSTNGRVISLRQIQLERQRPGSIRQ